MAASETKPFDFSSIIQNMDPQAFIKQMQTALSSFQLPNIDSSALMAAQKKNMETLAAANKAALAGTQELYKRQSEMLRQAMNDATEAAKALTKSGSAKEAAAKETELVQTAFEKALTNSTEISEIIKKNQDEVAKLVNQRVIDSLTEIKETINKMK